MKSDKIIITESIEVDALHMNNSICFICSQIKLDACYDIDTKKITGKGARACKDMIRAYVENLNFEVK